MSDFKNLPYFLEAECNYTRGAVLAGSNPDQFRNRVLEELVRLEKRCNTSLYPLRANNLRRQQDRIQELLLRYS